MNTIRAGPAQPQSAALIARIDTTLFGLLRARAAASTICPSEVARAVARGPADAGASEAGRGVSNWRALMPLVRERAAAWAGLGRLRISRAGELLDPAGSLAGGPIRIGRGPGFERVADDCANPAEGARGC
jgi:hypothetical protein